MARNHRGFSDHLLPLLLRLILLLLFSSFCLKSCSVSAQQDHQGIPSVSPSPFHTVTSKDADNHPHQQQQPKLDDDEMTEVSRLLEAGEFTLEGFPDAPLQLVRPDHHHKRLVIVEENLRLLQAISQPVSTVSVVGKFHSGKSYLMNQLMAKSAGFGIGSQVTPETMGIWVWGRVSLFCCNFEVDLFVTLFICFIFSHSKSSTPMGPRSGCFCWTRRVLQRQTFPRTTTPKSSPSQRCSAASCCTTR